MLQGDSCIVSRSDLMIWDTNKYFFMSGQPLMTSDGLWEPLEPPGADLLSQAENITECLFLHWFSSIFMISAWGSRSAPEAPGAPRVHQKSNHHSGITLQHLGQHKRSLSQTEKSRHRKNSVFLKKRRPTNSLISPVIEVFPKVNFFREVAARWCLKVNFFLQIGVKNNQNSILLNFIRRYSVNNWGDSQKWTLKPKQVNFFQRFEGSPRTLVKCATWLIFQTPRPSKRSIFKKNLSIWRPSFVTGLAMGAFTEIDVLILEYLYFHFLSLHFCIFFWMHFWAF